MICSHRFFISEQLPLQTISLFPLICLLKINYQMCKSCVRLKFVRCRNMLYKKIDYVVSRLPTDIYRHALIIRGNTCPSATRWFTINVLHNIMVLPFFFSNFCVWNSLLRLKSSTLFDDALASRQFHYTFTTKCYFTCWFSQVLITWWNIGIRAGSCSEL